MILGTVALSYGSVPMYKMICQTTGWGGQPVRAPGHGGGGAGGAGFDPSTRLVPVQTAGRIRVTFNASVSDTLPPSYEQSVLPPAYTQVSDQPTLAMYFFKFGFRESPFSFVCVWGGH